MERDETWKVGIDIGGTFTDIIGIQTASGEVRTAKVRSQTKDPIASIVSAFASIGVDWDTVDDLMHGTTMATNAIVEGNLARVALLATNGFRDVIEIGRQNRRELYRLAVPPKLPPLVPRDHRIEVEERVGPEGQVLTALSQDEATRVAKVVGALDAEAVAVALMHSYINPEHEKLLAQALATNSKHVALSHEMSPEPREFERNNTTILNAALMPLTAGYLNKLETNAGGRANVHLFHSAGGMASITAVRERPLSLALSGPAAGVAAAGKIARELGLELAIGFDMGGTTTDACVVIDGRVQVSTDQRIAGQPVRQLMTAVESIGAGGGSVARVDGTAVRVGPDSAGAEPGPACYGLGGVLPTVTDANLTLGFLSTKRLLGGVIQLDMDKAQTSVMTLGSDLDMPLHETALGVYQIANASMARALRSVTVERGVDARHCALIAFGGAGPMHAVALAREFGIAQVVVPKFSSVFSALGCLTAEMSYGEQKTVSMLSSDWDQAAINTTCKAMQDKLSAPILASGSTASDTSARFVALVRYAGQSDTVEVAFDMPCDPKVLNRDFRAQHEKLYGFSTDEPWILEVLRTTVAARSKSDIADLSESKIEATKEPLSVDQCWFETSGAVPTQRFERGALPVGWDVEGPAIIEDDWSTIVMPPGATAQVHQTGHLIIQTGVGK